MRVGEPLEKEALEDQEELGEAKKREGRLVSRDWSKGELGCWRKWREFVSWRSRREEVLLRVCCRDWKSLGYGTPLGARSESWISPVAWSKKTRLLLGVRKMVGEVALGPSWMASVLKGNLTDMVI
jgi:hypothetical protein